MIASTEIQTTQLSSRGPKPKPGRMLTTSDKVDTNLFRSQFGLLPLFLVLNRTYFVEGLQRTGRRQEEKLIHVVAHARPAHFRVLPWRARHLV